jgi:predicted secreted Zn-dependent protease
MRYLSVLMSALIAATIANGAAAVEPSPRPTNPMCEWAFSQAVERMSADLPPSTAAGGPGPGARLEIGAVGTSLDEAVRLCATVEDFEYEARLHVETLGQIDTLEFLADRCRDVSAGLGKYSTCFYLEQELATPAPTPTPTVEPSPSASPSATPQATKKPRPAKKPRPTPGPTAPPVVPAATTPRQRLTTVPSKFLADVPGATRVHYFAVRGNTSERLLTSMRKQAGKYCRSVNASACMETRNLQLRARYRQDPSTGSCRITSVKISRAYVAHMPVWTGPRRVPAAMVWWWKKSIARTGWHEAQHVKISRRHAARLPNLVIGKPCHRYSRIVKQWGRSLQREQKAFDRLDYPRGHRMDRRWWRAAHERFPS